MPVPPVLQTDKTIASSFFVAIQIAVYDRKRLEPKTIDVAIFLRFLGILAVFDRYILSLLARTVGRVCKVLKIDGMNIRLGKCRMMKKKEDANNYKYRMFHSLSDGY